MLNGVVLWRLHEEEKEVRVSRDHVLSALRMKERLVVLALRNQLQTLSDFFRRPPREVWHVL